MNSSTSDTPEATGKADCATSAGFIVDVLSNRLPSQQSISRANPARAQPGGSTAKDLHHVAWGASKTRPSIPAQHVQTRANQTSGLVKERLPEPDQAMFWRFPT